MSTEKSVVVLFSGGLDSATCLAMVKQAGFRVYALSVSYGQRHSVELEAACRLARKMGVMEHRIASLPLSAWGGSSLTDEKIVLPDYQDSTDIPSTYVPARNTLLLSLALAWAEVLSASEIYLGVSQVDYSGYPDCRPEFISAFQHLANLATKGAVLGHPVKIQAPLINLSKAQTIRLGLAHGLDYADTISCYRANKDGRACGRCDSCALRRRGFEEASVPDPTQYVELV